MSFLTSINKKHYSWKLIVGLIAAVVLDSVLQIMWKTAVLETPNDATFLETLAYVLSNPLFIAVITIMACQFFNWLLVLGEADLSFAKPIAALSYVSVPVLSVVMLHESIGLLEIIGIIFVLIGVWFISQTKTKTEDNLNL